MKFHGNEVVATSYDAWKSIKESNNSDLVVFSSYTSETVAETCYGFKSADFPLMCARSEGENWNRSKHKYYLVVSVQDEEK